MKYFTYFYIIKLKDMREAREFVCSMTGVSCIVIADKQGDEICLSKDDFKRMYPKKSYKKASKRFA